MYVCSLAAAARSCRMALDSQCMPMLSSMLGDENIPFHARNVAGIDLKMLSQPEYVFYILRGSFASHTLLTYVRSPQEANLQTNLAGQWLNGSTCLVTPNTRSSKTRS